MGELCDVFRYYFFMRRFILFSDMQFRIWLLQQLLFFSYEDENQVQFLLLAHSTDF